jgi:hypothetical protein
MLKFLYFPVYFTCKQQVIECHIKVGIVYLSAVGVDGKAFKRILKEQGVRM